MPKLSAAALKARIDRLQKQLDAAEADKAPAIKKVRLLMKKLGLTFTDLTGGAVPARRGRPPRAAKSNGTGAEAAKSKKNRGKVAVKFRDDKGNTWTGRGKTPRWLVAAEKTGRDRESFKIG